MNERQDAPVQSPPPIFIGNCLSLTSRLFLSPTWSQTPRLILGRFDSTAPRRRQPANAPTRSNPRAPPHHHRRVVAERLVSGACCSGGMRNHRVNRPRGRNRRAEACKSADRTVQEFVHRSDWWKAGSTANFPTRPFSGVEGSLWRRRGNEDLAPVVRPAPRQGRGEATRFLTASSKPRLNPGARDGSALQAGAPSAVRTTSPRRRADP